MEYWVKKFVMTRFRFMSKKKGGATVLICRIKEEKKKGEENGGKRDVGG
jgi:hypothetical protein